MSRPHKTHPHRGPIPTDILPEPTNVHCFIITDASAGYNNLQFDIKSSYLGHLCMSIWYV